MIAAAALWACLLLAPTANDPPSIDARKHVLEAEAKRIEVIRGIIPPTVCIFDTERVGGGSGVLIDREGYGLTNFHVVMQMMATRRGLGGLSDGRIYTLEVLGVDITGDVAMFRLTGRDDFPFAPLGDSDEVRIGHPVIAAGNPFVLAEDYTPTVTTGIVTGIHRYQGEGETLVYSDCIQTDAAINPGNSGGPLFDDEGRIIGINGRISAEMHRYARGRFNVGLGYAISINQIKRFMPSLRAGLLSKHGTLLATVMDDVDGVIFNDLYEDAPAWNAGIRLSDRLLRFGNVDIRSANQFLSILGTYPDDWPVPITFQSRNRKVSMVIRLEGVTPRMAHQYTMPAQANQNAAERAVRAFRRAVGRGDENLSPKAWNWDAKRTDDQNPPASFHVSDTVGRAPPDIPELDPIDALVYAGMHALRWKLLAQDSVWEDNGFVHAGTDALVTIDEAGHVLRERLLESILFPLTEHVSLKVGFELDTHLPARLVVRDKPSQRQVEIELDDYRSAGDIVWPHKMTVRSPKRTYQETVSNLNVDF